MGTDLLYLSDASLSSADAEVIDVFYESGSTFVVVDRTPAFPQGGGQPSDIGTMKSIVGAEFTFNHVSRGLSGLVNHRGEYEKAPFQIGDLVTIEIEETRRAHNSRLHTAGELICAAVDELGFSKWAVGSACHLPGQARVAFHTSLQELDVGSFRADLADCLGSMIKDDHAVLSCFVADANALGALCPTEIAKDFPEWPVRMISPFPGFWRPCLGAHCRSTAEIGEIVLKKVRLKIGELSVGYELASSLSSVSTSGSAMVQG